MNKPYPMQRQPQQPPERKTEYPDLGTYHGVSVKGSGGAAATVVVKTVQGHVWVSITPPFIWEAIMEPVKVVELIHALGLALDHAKKIALTRSLPSHGNKAIVREITSGTVAPNKAKGIRKAQP